MESDRDRQRAVTNAVQSDKEAVACRAFETLHRPLFLSIIKGQRISIVAAKDGLPRFVIALTVC